MLTRQHIYVDYFDNIFFYNEKVRQADDFNRQHRSWMWSQWTTIFRNIRFLPTAILNRHYDMTSLRHDEKDFLYIISAFDVEQLLGTAADQAGG